MKKVIKKVLLVSLCTICLVGCKDFFNHKNYENSNNITFENISYSSEASKVTGNLLALQIKTCEKAINTVSAYIDKPVTTRSVSVETDFIDIGNFLPADLSTLKRNVSSGVRTASDKTVTLEEELNEIVQEYEVSLDAIKPDHSKAITVEGISSSETGYLFGDDAEIPFDSLQGIITTAILNEVAEGKDIEDVITTIGNDMSQINFETSERAVTLKSCGYWPKGTVFYRWGDITDEHKILMENAMNIWTEGTDNAVSFSELEDTDWINFTLGIGVRGCVMYNTKELPAGTGGTSYVGCLGGKQDLILSKTLPEDYFIRTPVHELGHAMGLQHEHTRHDRDDYVVISDGLAKDTVNYGKIPLFISDWRWESRIVRIGLWRIRVWYPAFWESEYSWQSDTFDFESVMLYPYLEVKSDKIDQNNGEENTKFNSYPSEKDFAMIKKMY